MRNLPRDAHFIAEASDRAFVPCDCRGEKLERNGLIERQVVGAIDFAHSAAAQQRDNAVAPHQHFPWQKPAKGSLGCRP